MTAPVLPPGTGEGLRWLVEQLWARPGVLVRGDEEAPAGWRPVERYAVVPDLATARFLVPLATRRAAHASTVRYNRLRPVPVRARRLAIGLGFGAGLAGRVLRARLVVHVPVGAPAAELGELLLGEHLRLRLGQPSLAMGIGIGAPDPARKPTLQLFAHDGRPLGYAKLGWSPVTRELVRSEVAALRRYQRRPLHSLGIPPLRLAGSWHHLEVAVTAPLPAGARRPRPVDRPPPAEVTWEIAASTGVRREPLRASAWWRRVLSETREVRRRDRGELGAALGAAVEALERRLGGHPVAFGAWHGDWVPWNLARSGRRLLAWDWEHSAASVPVGFDPLHHQFQVALLLRGRGVAESASRSERAAAPLLAALGVTTPAAELVTLYLVELLLRVWRMHAHGAGWPARLYPALPRALAERVR